MSNTTRERIDGCVRNFFHAHSVYITVRTVFITTGMLIKFKFIQPVNEDMKDLQCTTIHV